MRGDAAKALRQRYPGDRYAAFHAPRYLELMGLLDAYVQPGMIVLDIGRSRLTELIHERYDVRVDGLGFLADEPSPQGRNWWFDLNRAADRSQWRSGLPMYDVIVMAEVIEHLYTAPKLVLSFLRSLLTDRGVLIIQTPNAAALHKRAELLLGRNPYELIRETMNDPGHFREYTKKELIQIVEEAGLTVDRWFAGDYFDYRFVQGSGERLARLGRPLNLIYRCAPPSLKPGQTLVVRRES